MGGGEGRNRVVRMDGRGVFQRRGRDLYVIVYLIRCLKGIKIQEF